MKLCLICSRQFDDSIQRCANDGSSLISMGKDKLMHKSIGDGRYRIDSLLGRGLVGRVYKAIRTTDGVELAVKVLHDYLREDQESLARFRREALALSRLKHPGILSVIDSGTLPTGQLFFVMELLQGRTLEQTLKAEGYLSLARAMPLFEQICSALSAAHAENVIHRDIKPANVFICEGTDIVKVLDFGIAKLAASNEPQITQDNVILGSPAYMSPEQCRSMNVHVQSDIYSLSVVIFETLTGRRPFVGKDAVSLARQHTLELPPRISTLRPELRLPVSLDSVLVRGLAKHPEARPKSVTQFWHELKAATRRANAYS